ncbi:hypothetical protein ACOMHN_013114 [Nucella lapillus]
MYKHQNEETWYNGRLNPDQERRVLQNERFLIDDLQTDQLLEVKITKVLFNVYDINAISYASTKHEKNKKLLEILRGKNPTAFHYFLQGLLDTGHDEAYRRLTLPDEPDVTKGEVAVQTERVADNENEPRASEDSIPSSPDSDFSATSLAEEQKYQQGKLTSIEDRVDKLADSVQDLSLKVDASNQRVLQANQAHDAKLVKLQHTINKKDDLLQSATQEIKNLRCKIEELEQEKTQALDKANKTIDCLSKKIEELNKEKTRLEEQVKRVTSENKELRRDVEKIIRDKERVQHELERQRLELKAINARNDLLEERLNQKDKTLQFVVSKVNTIEMKVDSRNVKPRKLRPSKPGRIASYRSSNDEEPVNDANSPVVSDPQKKTRKRLVPEPAKQCVARPNSKKH